MSPIQDESELLRRAADGDEAAAGLIYDKYSASVLRFLVVMLGDAQAAEDAMQETFMALFRTAGRYDPALAGLGTWLQRIAFNFARNEIRRRGRKPALSLDTPVQDDGRMRPLAELLPDSEPGTADAAAFALEVLGSLREEDREVLVLRYMEDLPPREIAAVLGISPKAVSMRLWRALDQIRNAHPDVRNIGRRTAESGQENCEEGL